MTVYIYTIIIINLLDFTNFSYFRPSECDKPRLNMIVVHNPSCIPSPCMEACNMCYKGIFIFLTNRFHNFHSIFKLYVYRCTIRNL